MSLLPTPRRRGRLGLLALLGAALPLAVASAVATPLASAATATLASGTLAITDEAGHSSTFTVGVLANPLRLPSLDKVVVDGDTRVEPPAGCAHPVFVVFPDPTALLCDRALVRGIQLELGDRDDSVLRPLALTVVGARVLPAGADLPLELGGGAGNDLLQGGEGPDLVAGGDGDDAVLGFAGDDTLIGDLGADRVEPGTGANTVDVGTPEVDVVALADGGSGTITASPNDTFLGAVSSVKVRIAGPAPVGVEASAQVDPPVARDEGMPGVTDLLAGLDAVVPGGRAPDGVSLPVQPVFGALGAIAGRLSTEIDVRARVGLPLGVTLDETGLHITVGCAVDCEILGNGVIDTGTGPAPLAPATVKTEAVGGAAVAATRLNLGIGLEYTKLTRTLRAGRCAVVVTRLRIRTARGSEVVSYALPACGAKLTFEPVRQPQVSRTRATRRLVALAQCSAECTLAPRFLMVKRGGTVVARTDRAAVRASATTASGGIAGARSAHTTIWKLTAGQERAITRAARGGHAADLRYIVSGRATSGGVTTTGTASFRTRGR